MTEMNTLEVVGVRQKYACDHMNFILPDLRIGMIHEIIEAAFRNLHLQQWFIMDVSYWSLLTVGELPCVVVLSAIC
jgi:hypothetical protein